MAALPDYYVKRKKPHIKDPTSRWIAGLARIEKNCYNSICGSVNSDLIIMTVKVFSDFYYDYWKRGITMTDREFAEIKKRFKPEKNNITYVRGCHVSSTKEIVSDFKIPVTMLPDEQKEWLLKILKKPITGAVGRNLMNIEFSADQVTEGEEHKLLSDIRESELEDAEKLNELYQKIIDTYPAEGDYLIMLAYDRYDVPSYSKNDEISDDSTEMFRYYVCAVCPIKITKTALGFSSADSEFKNIGGETSVMSPEIGFMFPCFDDRRTNIYNAVFYSKSTKESYPETVESLFGTTAQMPAAEQKETFVSLVADATSESRNFEFVQSVHGMISDMMNEHKESHDPEPLMLDKNDVKRVLKTCGANEEEMTDFDEKFTSEFGESTVIPPLNIINPKQFELKNSYVTINIDPQYSFMVNTKVIDGVKYVMVRADEGVEVNGISIHFDGENIPKQATIEQSDPDESDEMSEQV